MYICKGCKKEIKTKNKMYCNFECRKFGKIYKCDNCNIDIYKSRYKHFKYHYCSKKCYFEIRKKDKTKCSNYGNYKRKEFLCLSCDKVNIITQKRQKKFCNQLCRREYLKKNPYAASNYKGGKFINCSYCGKQKWKYLWDLKKKDSKKYCSIQCYMKDPLSPNRQFGEDNSMANPIAREKVRVGVIKHILKYNKDGLTTGKNEKKILDFLEKKYNIKIERHLVMAGYIVDGYIREKNLVVEIDEKYHTFDCYKKKDIIRQKYIEECCGCKFLRIRDYIKEDVENARV